MKKAIIVLMILSGTSFSFTKSTLKNGDSVKPETSYLKKLNTGNNPFATVIGNAKKLKADSTPDGDYIPGSTVAISDSGEFELVYQTDGNLVLYSRYSNPRALWASGPITSTPQLCRILSGHIYLFRTYFNEYYVENTNPCSPTYGTGNGYLVLQDDGNLVRYSYDCSKAVSTETQGGQVSHHFGVFK